MAQRLVPRSAREKHSRWSPERQPRIELLSSSITPSSPVSLPHSRSPLQDMAGDLTAAPCKTYTLRLHLEDLNARRNHDGGIARQSGDRDRRNVPTRP